ncbi:MAG: SRPBCC family protein [Betaproteobacteria bacterium]|jgi:carbon monoxide dehydrogenase subunit G
MKVTIDRTFPMPAGADVAWSTLSDIEQIASCMPGASITERIDATHYKGTVKVKVGPAMLNFRGDIEVKERDEAARSLRLVAKGTDQSGTSAASLDLTARIDEAAEGSSSLVGHSESTVSGKAATFGGRMMDAVADQILKQFAANFAARVAAQAKPPAPPPSETTAETTPSAAAATAGGAPAAAATPSERAAQPAAPPPAAKPLNAFALLWAVIRDWFRGLFHKKTA